MVKCLTPQDQSYRQKQTLVEQTEDKIFWKDKFWVKQWQVMEGDSSV